MIMAFQDILDNSIVGAKSHQAPRMPELVVWISLWKAEPAKKVLVKNGYGAGPPMLK